MILYGKELAEKITNEIKGEVERLGISPKLGIIVIGEYRPSKIYVRKKVETAAKTGIRAEVFALPETTSEKELLLLIGRLNSDDDIDGFIVQTPIPDHISEDRVMEAIDPVKDVDGFHPSNMGRVFQNLQTGFAPATPSGIIRLLDFYNVKIDGANAVVVGRSNTVGKPIALMLLHRNATVTICHSKTKNLADYTSNADILVVAAGAPGLIKGNMVKDGAYVIDVGTTRVGEKVVGDVDPAVQNKANVSPVPGGVGPLTVAMLLGNVLKAAKIRKN